MATMKEADWQNWFVLWPLVRDAKEIAIRQLSFNAFAYV